MCYIHKHLNSKIKQMTQNYISSNSKVLNVRLVQRVVLILHTCQTEAAQRIISGCGRLCVCACT